MLTPIEKAVFIVAALATLAATWKVAERIISTIRRGKGRPDLRIARARLVETLLRIVSLQPTFSLRWLASILHAFVAWGFMFYLLVNLGDVLNGFLPGFEFMGRGILGGTYRLIADILSAAVLVGMAGLIFRRWLIRPATLTARSDVLLQPFARSGIKRDSAIVGAFILVHVGSRFLGASIKIAESGNADPWQPSASATARIWMGMAPSLFPILSHVFFWLALGTIMLFFPYFLYSKHIHLFFAPLNFLLKPARRSIGELSKIDFDDMSLEQFGATRLEDLGWEQIMDSYACIMCFRCQEVCPAYNTGKVLSPAALEINKRYLLNVEGGKIAKGVASSKTLLEFCIPEEAVWACTACGACVDICPVNNEPMRDILEIRRALVLMDNSFPKEYQTAFRGMERNSNPWNISPADRMKWAEGLDVPTIEKNPAPEILWWVGCAPATDARAQKTARAFATILKAAGVNFAVLGEAEQCSGDSARRAGKEDIFFALASANVEILNEIKPPRIVTTCPHCLHTLKNEYPAFNGHYKVIHHTQLIDELMKNGKVKLVDSSQTRTTFHDPCYLGRQNGIIEEPRQVLAQLSSQIVEMPRRGHKSFCCGAGGAQMWKEEEPGLERVNANRLREAVATGAETLAVGCPFCMVMLTDASKESTHLIQVRDIAEIVNDALVK